MKTGIDIWSDAADEAPGTKASALLLVPPGLPPGPPGADTPPGSGGGGRKRDPGPFPDELFKPFEEFAVIRTTYETMDVFPDDAELCGEMESVIESASALLHIHLKHLVSSVAWRVRLSRDQLGELREVLLRLAEVGEEGRWLNSMMKTNVSARPKRRIRLRERCPQLRRRAQVDDGEFLVRLLTDLLEEVQTGACRDRERVEDLYRDYVMVCFALFASVEPLFWSSKGPTDG